MRATCIRLLAFAAPVALATAAFAVPARAQTASDPGPDAPVSYDVSFPNAAHREAQISVTYRNLVPGAVEFRMSRASPGRYAVHEFAKNVYSVTAKDGAGKPLPVTRRDPYSWQVAGHDGSVTFSYTLYGDRGDGTYAQIDQSHAILNMPASFIWATGYDDQPIRVAFRPADPSWKIATQLPPVAGSSTQFWAPHLQYLLDSPTELSDFHLREWTVAAGGKPQSFRLAVHSNDTPETIDRFAAQSKKVVDALIRVWGEAPAFDFGTYTFIANYLPHATGDGMEHRNSTVISYTESLAADPSEHLGTLSHELNHAWLVERLRPAELEPFDFTRANATPNLWFVEGFTSYYGPLAIRRAGVSGNDAYLGEMGAILSHVLNHSGRDYDSAEGMSVRAPLVDAATAIDPLNGRTYTSYYPYGAVIALGLDLTLRQRFNSNLDAYMRLLWTKLGRAQRDFAPVTPFTSADLEAGLAELTGDPEFAKRFFDTQIRGSALPDFGPLLAQAGMVLRPADPQQGWIGATRVTPVAGPTPGVALAETPVPKTPIYVAGLDRGDVITAVNSTATLTGDAWNAALAQLTPGKPVVIAYRNRIGSHSVTLTAIPNPRLEIVTLESTGGKVTKAQANFRRSWLDQ